ncbi:hypothetical protein BT93_H0899 [Corymbia citriodora subsp. variegata]|nr:hypothetical protein BT93_H0899 [Corymbia citriodora subsp. variegata]
MALFSCGLLGAFLLLSSFPFLALSTPSRHLLAGSSTVIQQYLAPHNAVRSRLGLPPLQWSQSLASYASSWARQRRGDCALIHSSGNYGENLFWGAGSKWRPGDAVAAWAAEGPYYDYGSNTCAAGRDCLHYTQLVWRQSLRVGCARVICANGDTFITCNYDPHGNVIGQRPY